MTVLEIAANAMATISILLAGRNSIHTWWTGILGCLLFAALFFQAALYADVVLQAFFVVTSAAGWWRWRQGTGGPVRGITRTSLRKLAMTVPVGLLATAGYGALLHAFTDAYAPFVDSAVLVFSVIAQLLLIERRLETWIFWVLVNTIAVGLYASRGLTLTAVLYAGYWVNAVVAWRGWRRQAALPVAA